MNLVGVNDRLSGTCGYAWSRTKSVDSFPCGNTAPAKSVDMLHSDWSM